MSSLGHCTAAGLYIAGGKALGCHMDNKALMFL